MADVTYTSFYEDLCNGDIVPATDTFKCLLVTSTYAPDKDTHVRRSDVTNEVSGTGYAAGGATVTCTVGKNTSTDRVTLTFSSPSWSTATITARGAVIYKSRGGASSADELVAYSDFGSDITSTAGTFAVTFSTPLTIQN